MIDDANGIHGMPEGWIPAGEQHLDGHHALWYARSREFVDDYSRIARQQCVQQAMLKQLDPGTVLTKFEDIASAGTKIVESNISSAQLGSFADLAMKSKEQPVSRLTIGPPDFDAAFSTFPDFDQIHERVRQLLAAQTPSPSAAGSISGTESVADDAVITHDAGVSAGPMAGGVVPATTQPTPSSDFTPVTTTPDGRPITEAMLNGLKAAGNEQALRELVATNGQCAPL
jgi:hypothetical protein